MGVCLKSHELPSYLCVEGAEFSSYRLGQACYLFVWWGEEGERGSFATRFVSGPPSPTMSTQTTGLSHTLPSIKRSRCKSPDDGCWVGIRPITIDAGALETILPYGNCQVSFKFFEISLNRANAFSPCDLVSRESLIYDLSSNSPS